MKERVSSRKNKRQAHSMETRKTRGKRNLQTGTEHCTLSETCHSRTAHIFIGLTKFRTVMICRTARFNNVFDDFLQRPVVVLITRDPWWFPDMPMPRVAKDLVRQVFVGFETFIYGHMETTQHDGDKSRCCQ